MAASATDGAAAPVSVAEQIRTIMEWLWLAAIFLVPLIMVRDTFMAGFIQMPKVFVFRTLVLLLGILWAWEWALTPAKVSRPNAPFKTALPLRVGPQRLIALGSVAVILVVIISAALSPVPRVSIWGIDPGWDTYAVYSTAAYVLLFWVVATHLRTDDQLRRLLYSIAGAGTLAAIYGIGQHFGYDPLRTEIQDGTRAGLTMGNPIFAGAFLAMSLPITLALGLTIRGRFSAPWHIGILTAPAAAQTTALLFTLSRGPWLGTTLGVAAVIIFLALCEPRTSARVSSARTLIASIGAIALVSVVVVMAEVPWTGSLVGLASILAVFLLARQAPAKLKLPATEIVLTVALITLLMVVISSSPWTGLVIALLAGFGLFGLFRESPDSIRAVTIVGLSLTVAVLISMVPAAGVTRSDEQSTVAGRVAGIVEETTSGGLSSRFVIWQTAGRVVATRPWVDTETYPELPNIALRNIRPLIGYGPDIFPYVYPLIGETRATSSVIAHGHNFLVHAMVEIGLLGVAAYLIIALGAFLTLLRVFLTSPAAKFSSSQILLIVGITGAMVGRAGEQFTGKAQVSDLVVMWALLGAVVALTVLGQPGNPPPAPARARGSRARPAAGENVGAIPLTLGIAVVVTVLVSGLWWQVTARPVLASVAAQSAEQAFKADDLNGGFAKLDSALGWHSTSSLYHMRRSSVLSEVARQQPTPSATLQLMSAADDEARAGLAWNALDPRVWSRIGELSREVAFLDKETQEISTERALRANTLLTQLLPGHWQALGALAWAHARLGQPEEALRITEESLDTTEEETLEAGLAHFIRGVAFRDLGRLDEAVAALELSARLVPTGPANAILQEIQMQLGSTGAK